MRPLLRAGWPALFTGLGWAALGCIILGCAGATDADAFTCTWRSWQLCAEQLGPRLDDPTLPADERERARAWLREGCTAGEPSACEMYALEIAAARQGFEPRFAEAIELLTAPCDAGRISSCVVLGRALVQPGEHQDFERAVPVLTRACEAGRQASCFDLAVRLHRGQGIAQDLGRAAQLYAGACEQGIRMACENEAIVREQTGDFAGARARWEQLCEPEGSRGCTALALALRDERSGPVDLPRAQRLLESACPTAPAACFELGLDRFEGRYGQSTSVPEALTLWERTCEAGHGPSCSNAGVVWEMGQGVPADLDRALPLLGRACELEHAGGCFNLGMASADHRWPAFVRACELGHVQACKEIGQIALDNGDPAMAGEAWSHGCELGEPSQCASAADLAEDPARAAALRERACAGGHRASCR